MLGIKPENIFIDDLREEFVRDFVFPMFRANALYEGQYLLGTSIARPLIAKRQIEIAREVGADAVCSRRHRQGQRPGPLRARLLRAEARHQGDRAVARVGARRSRTKLIEFAEKHQIPIAKDKRGEAPFSVDANLLHSSSEGKVLEDPWDEADEMRLPAHHLARGGARQGDLHHDRLREGRRRSRSTARSCRRRPCSPSSTSSARPTASAGSTWSRTASSA